MEADIYRLIDSGSYLDAESLIKDLLAPALSGESADVKIKNKAAHHGSKILFKLAAGIDKISELADLEIISRSSQDCIECLLSVNTESSSTEKNIARLIIIFQQKDFHEGAILIAELYVKYMVFTATTLPENLAKIRKTVFTCLWNSALKDGVEKQCHSALNLRLMAILTVVLGGDWSTEILLSSQERMRQTISCAKQTLGKARLSSGSDIVSSCCAAVIQFSKHMRDGFVKRLERQLELQNVEVEKSSSESEFVGSEKLGANLSVTVQLILKCIDFLIRSQQFTATMENVENIVIDLITRYDKLDRTDCKDIMETLCRIQLLGLESKVQKQAKTSAKNSFQKVLGTKINQVCLQIKTYMNQQLISISESQHVFVSVLCTMIRLSIVTMASDVSESTKVGVAMTNFTHLSQASQSQIANLHQLLSQLVYLDLSWKLRAVEDSIDMHSADREKLLKKCKSLQLDYIMAFSDTLYIYAGFMSNIQDISSKDWKHSVEFCSRNSQKLSDYVMQAKQSKHMAISSEEHNHLGFLLYKLGKTCYYKGAYAASVELIELSCSHYAVWAKSASPSQLAKQSAFKRFDGLAQAYRQTDSYREALRCLLRCVLLDPSSLDSVCECWLYLKHEANKAGFDESVQKWVLWSELRRKACELDIMLPDSLSAVAVCEAETRATRAREGLSVHARLCVIEEHSKHVHNKTVERCCVLLDLSEVLWRTRREHDEKSAEGYCKDVLDVLARAEQICGEKSPVNLLDCLARAHLLMAIIRDVDVLQMKAANEERVARRKEKQSQRAAVSDVTAEDVPDEDLYMNCTSAYGERVLRAHALAALTTWMRLTERHSPLSGGLVPVTCLCDVTQTLQAMLQLATIFRLALMHKEMTAILHILLPLCVAHNQPQILLRGTSYLALMLNSQKQPLLSLTFLTSVQRWLDGKGNKFDKIQGSTEYIYCVAVKAETQLLLNQVDEGFKTLERSIELKAKHKQARTKEELELESYIRRVHSRYASLPKSFWTHGLPCEDDLAIEVLMRAIRSLCGVINATLGSSFIGPSETTPPQAENGPERWHLLCELLDTFAEVGTVLCQLGDGREAAMHLSQGLLIAQTFHLSKRLALFHLLLTRLDNVSGKFQSALAHLHTAHFILHSETATPSSDTEDSPQPSNLSNNYPSDQPNNRPSDQAGPGVAMTPAGAGSGDGFSTPATVARNVDGTPTPFNIKTKPLDFEDHLEFLGEKTPDRTQASPKHKKEQLHLPAFWSHDPHCACHACVDVALIHLSCLYVLCYAELYVMQGKYKLATRTLNTLFSKLDSLSQLSTNLLTAYMRPYKTNPSNSPLFASKDFSQMKLNASTLHDVFIEACKLMTFMALVELDISRHRMWTKRMQACLDLDAHPWMVTSHINMAEVGYLDSVPSLPWPKVVENESLLDTICMEIGKINLTSEANENVATPEVKQKVKARVAAPVKKKRGGQVVTFIEDDEDSPPPRKIPDFEADATPQKEPMPLRLDALAEDAPSDPNVPIHLKVNSESNTANELETPSVAKGSNDEIDPKNQQGTNVTGAKEESKAKKDPSPPLRKVKTAGAKYALKPKATRGGRNSRKKVDPQASNFTIFTDDGDKTSTSEHAATLETPVINSKPVTKDKASKINDTTGIDNDFVSKPPPSSSARNVRKTLVIDSESDEEILQTPLKPKRTGRSVKSTAVNTTKSRNGASNKESTTTAKRGRGRGNAKTETPDVLKESSVLNTPSIQKEPRTSLMRLAMKNNMDSKGTDEAGNVFDFVPSDSDSPVKANRGRGRKASASTAKSKTSKLPKRENKRALEVESDSNDRLSFSNDENELPLKTNETATEQRNAFKEKVATLKSRLNKIESNISAMLPKKNEHKSAENLTCIPSIGKPKTPSARIAKPARIGRSRENLSDVTQLENDDVTEENCKEDLLKPIKTAPVARKPRQNRKKTIEAPGYLDIGEERLTRAKTRLEGKRASDSEDSEPEGLVNMSLIELEVPGDFQEQHQGSEFDDESEPWIPLQRDELLHSLSEASACSQLELSQSEGDIDVECDIQDILHNEKLELNGGHGKDLKCDALKKDVELCRAGEPNISHDVPNISIEDVASDVNELLNDHFHDNEQFETHQNSNLNQSAHSDNFILSVTIDSEDEHDILRRDNQNLLKSDDEIEILRGDDQKLLKPKKTGGSKSSKDGMELPRKAKFRPAKGSSVRVFCDEEQGPKAQPSTPMLCRMPISIDTPSTARHQFVSTSYKMSAFTFDDDDNPVTIATPAESKSKMAISEPQTLKLYLCHTLKMLSRNPPSIPYRQVCQALALLCVSEQETREAVYYLTEAHSVVFRHNALLCISKKLKKLPGASDAKTSQRSNQEDKSAHVREKLTKMADTLAFNKGPADITAATKQLPEGWTVCQISVLTRPDRELGDMYITQLRGSSDEKHYHAVLQRLPGFSTTRGQKVLSEFDSILEESAASMQITESVEWWTKRGGLDKRVKEVLSDMDAYWLGGWRCLFLGLPADEQTRISLDKHVDHVMRELLAEVKVELSQERLYDVRTLVKAILNGAHTLGERDLIQTVYALFEILDTKSSELEKTVDKYVKKMRQINKALDAATRLPVILILDRSVQHLPWECMCHVRPHTLSRMPSLYFLHALLHQQRADPDTVFSRGVNMNHTYYVLNPENNLANTEKKFVDFFSKHGWKGITAKAPSLQEYTEALEKHDFFVYCGHGDGGKFVSRTQLQALDIRACVMLMGCSSGRLRVQGNLEASGLMLNYFLAGCPSVMGALWDVTDKDIDRFTEKLLQSMLSAPPGERMWRTLAECRDACRLPWLIGAAPVIYGLPLTLATKHKRPLVSGCGAP